MYADMHPGGVGGTMSGQHLLSILGGVTKMGQVKAFLDPKRKHVVEGVVSVAGGAPAELGRPRQRSQAAHIGPDGGVSDRTILPQRLHVQHIKTHLQVSGSPFLHARPESMR